MELHKYTHITDRLKQILHWLAMGKTNEEIGLIVGISPLTVKNYIRILAFAYGISGNGARLMIVMAALTRGDLNFETFRETYMKLIANGSLAKE